MSEKPKTWTRLESKQKDGSLIKLRIQDLPSGRMDDAIEFLVKYAITEEAFQVAAGIYKNIDAIQEYRMLMKGMFSESQNISSLMACVDDSEEPGEIIGLSFVGIDKNTDKIQDLVQNLEIKTEEIKNLFHIILVLEGYTPDKTFETYYGGRGIVVHPEYRGLGLATEFVKVRKLVCIDHKVPMTCAWMTAIGTQKAANKNNWKTSAEITLEELEKKTGIKFERKLPSFKLMYTTVD